MTLVRYIGPHDAVDLYHPDGHVATVKHGDKFETTEEHAAGLLEQPTNWEPVKAAGKSAKAEKED